MFYRNLILIIVVLIPLMSAKVTYGVSPKLNCNGSISIGYEDYDGNVATTTLRGSRRKYPNIKVRFPVLRDCIISYIEVLGDCCWQVYSKRKFNGETQIMYPIEDAFYISFQPVSVERMKECL